MNRKTHNISHKIGRMFVFKSFLFNLNAYLWSSNFIYTIHRSLILKAQWIKNVNEGVRRSCCIGFQILPKHFLCRYIKVFKRLHISCWLFGIYIDRPRAFKIKEDDYCGLWEKI